MGRPPRQPGVLTMRTHHEPENCEEVLELFESHTIEDYQDARELIRQLASCGQERRDSLKELDALNEIR